MTLESSQFPARTFILGNGSGFILYLPVSENVHNRTLVPTKWFGAATLGRKYYETSRVWAVMGDKEILLSRLNQTSFSCDSDHAMRTFVVNGVTVHQTFFVPRTVQSFVMTLHSSVPMAFLVEPQFDMRYYQAFNDDTSTYSADASTEGAHTRLVVSNHCPVPGEIDGTLTFFAAVEANAQTSSIVLVQESERVYKKAYLKDEHRRSVIHNVYKETHERSPDEAPLWDMYETNIYAPARVRIQRGEPLVYGFGPTRDRALSAVTGSSKSVPHLVDQREAESAQHLTKAFFETGDSDSTTAYAQVMSSFNDALVVHDMKLNSPLHCTDNLSGIFAGNKYFLDMWKRDENIAIGGLLDTNDFESVRTILHETWQHQDERTGRLPHIIRVGEPLVYYSSDATLWALLRLHEYTTMSGDTTLLEHKYPLIERFFRASLSFVERGLLPSGGIIDKEYLWETWSDTPYTPRDGYPVEIELLWLAALKQYIPFIAEHDSNLADRLMETRATAERSFESFSLDGYLADSLSYNWEPRQQLTPNGYMAFACDNTISGDILTSMVRLARTELAGHCGIRSLAMREWSTTFNAELVNDRTFIRNGRMASVGIYNYHRGIEWLWLNQFFVRGELLYGDIDLAERLYVAGLTRAALHESGVGGLGELYDLHGPLGADYQAWSMAGYLSSLRAFSGVSIDAINRHIDILPAVPVQWPFLHSRHRCGTTTFEIRCGQHTPGKYQLDVIADSLPPDPISLRLGLRLPTGAVPTHVRLNRTALSRSQWQVDQRSQSGTADIVVDTTLSQHVKLSVSLG